MVQQQIKDKIQAGQVIDFNMEEFETISNSTILNQVYSERWWQDNDEENYFIMINNGKKDIPKGSQIQYNYGKRNNAYLLENYGFCLDENNQYNSLNFRAVLGTSPKEPIKHAQELLPTQKILEDYENLDTTTEVLQC
mmetsp:Transcript_42470/g.40713  ORF Transcript_42470/g.40713 Transcript_42470/m.40713 type:complete len:138 (+) Transcript_42470:1107-1520(+)